MTEQERIEIKLHTEGQFKNGASWFYWIAGLSLLNTVIGLFNSSLSFVSGLGITQLVDGAAYILKEFLGSGIVFAGVFIDLFIISSFAVLGLLAYKRKKWAMISGIVIYSLDLLTFLFVTDYLSILFHALAIFSIFRGIQALEKLKKLEAMNEITTDDEI